MIRSVSIRALRQATPLLRVVPAAAAVSASRGIHATPAAHSHYNDPASSATPAPPPKTLMDINKLYRNNTPITVLTAHDYISSKIANAAGVDIILVGDSLSMVALGYTNTNEIELDDMIHHARAVRRGSLQAFIVADLPFGSYEVSTEQALAAAFRMVKRAGVDAIKFEGGKENAGLVRHMSQRGIPVMGHIGLTPQRASSLGGFKVQGKTADSARKLLEDAHAVEEAGAFAVVLEAIPAELAERVSAELTIPTIGIGAGAGCDGQVLVNQDMLGMFHDFTPKFVRRFAEVGDVMLEAYRAYDAAVKDGSFPAAEHTYAAPAGVLENL